MRLSCRFAPLMVRLSGVPSPSTTKCRFVPALPRSVGLGPVSAPPLRRARTRCRARPGSSPAGRRGAVAPTAPDATLAKPRPRAIRPAGASTSYRCTPSRQARPATGCQSAAQRGCQSTPHGPAHAVSRRSASAAQATIAAGSPPSGRRKQEALPSSLNAQSQVSSPVLSSTRMRRVCKRRRHSHRRLGGGEPGISSGGPLRHSYPAEHGCSHQDALFRAGRLGVVGPIFGDGLLNPVELRSRTTPARHDAPDGGAGQTSLFR